MFMHILYLHLWLTVGGRDVRGMRLVQVRVIRFFLGAVAHTRLYKSDEK